MTRINCVPPAELHDKHLLAEYRELPRIFKLARHTSPNETPKVYTLGTGHMKFFFNKLSYLVKRQAKIIEELNQRGFVTRFTAQSLVDEYMAGTPLTLWNDWEPTEADKEVNRARLRDRLATMKGAK